MPLPFPRIDSNPGPRSTEEHLWSILDLIPLGVVLLGTSGQVIGMNTVAERLLADLQVCGEIAKALQIASTTGRYFARGTSRKSLEVAVMRISEGLVALIVADSMERSVVDPRCLTKLYALTASESRVVVALVSGSSTSHAAAQLRMSIHTLRRHLKSIFEKVGVERQSELVRVVLSGIASLHYKEHTPNE